KKEISDFITFITKISELLPKPLNNYKNQFVDRYGFNLAVPILDVFYDKKLLFDDDERLVRENQLYKSLMRKISNGNINSIIDISYLVSKYDYKPKRYHSGVEMSFYLLNNNDCFEYIISPLVGSDAIGRSFGRFDFYFDNKMSKRRNQILSTSPQYETVDLTFFPKEKTLLNVMNGPKSSEMQFKFGSNDFEENLNIQFDDIYIYLDSDGDFHFFDINSEKEIIFNVNNMVNLNYAPEIVRYIMALRSKSEPQVFDIFHVLNAIGTDLGFLPKITYKNFTITPKKKYIFKDLDNFYKVGLEKGLEKRIIQELLNCFPSGRFFLENGDNRIIVDIKTDIGQKIAIKELVNNQCLLASDIPFKAECLPINDGNNSYVGEFVFQIYSSNEQKVRQNNFEIMNTRPSEYSYLPFDKYLYYKIYCSRQNQNRLLQIEISPWVSKLKEEGLIKGFFYVKYKDEKDHLRLRFILNESTNIEKLTSINLNFLKQYEKKELIDDVTMNIYEREVYRYGGKDQLDELENIFSIESEVFLKSINCLSYTEKNFLFFNIVLYYLGISGVSSEEIVDMLKVYKMKKEHRKEFLIFFDENNNEKISHNIEQILKEFKYYEEEIAIALNRVRMHNSSEKRNEIYLSIFHMLHNRLIGIDRENENKIMSFTNREYRIAYEKKKGGQNNG
ncbi:thiopeptide-type bacteriocin biosynthesis protein, partial [Enterococcus faecalis]|nr:thiopeptide-type bacteriocin biosynthesis protein [Enterococcus faecalis]